MVAGKQKTFRFGLKSKAKELRNKFARQGFSTRLNQTKKGWTVYKYGYKK